jgi:hypothetical protein
MQILRHTNKLLKGMHGELEEERDVEEEDLLGHHLV